MVKNEGRKREEDEGVTKISLSQSGNLISRSLSFYLNLETLKLTGSIFELEDVNFSVIGFRFIFSGGNKTSLRFNAFQEKGRKKRQLFNLAREALFDELEV